MPQFNPGDVVRRHRNPLSYRIGLSPFVIQAVKGGYNERSMYKDVNNQYHDRDNLELLLAYNENRTDETALAIVRDNLKLDDPLAPWELDGLAPLLAPPADIWAPVEVAPALPDSLREALTTSGEFHEVARPSHYNRGGIELLDISNAWDLGRFEFNVIKYTLRAKYKGTELKDLQKAQQFINHAIALLESKTAEQPPQSEVIMGSDGRDHVA